MKRLTVVLFIGLICVPAGWAKRSGAIDLSKTRDRESLKLYLEYSPEFDTNTLKYSPSDITKFDNLTERNPSPVNTLSDWRNQFALRGNYADTWLLERRSVISTSFRWNSYATNSILNSNTTWWQLDQEVNDVLHLKTAFSYWHNIPLRNYIDRDTREWRLATFDQNEYTIKPVVKMNRFEGVTVSPYYQWRTQYYNEYFTEFDSKANCYGVVVDYKLNREWKLSGTYESIGQDNTGRGQLTAAPPLMPVPSDSTVDEEYGNSSYDETLFGLAAEWTGRVGKLGKVQFSGDYAYKFRQYSTSATLANDPYHAGREHDWQRVGIEVGGDPYRFTTMTIRLEHEWRKTTSPNAAVPLVKDYKATRFGITLAYKLF